MRHDYIQIQNHFGVDVKTHIVMDMLRKGECLCNNCNNKPRCETAKQLYSICKEKNIAMAITRCPDFMMLDGD